jgi:hypothetical protein
VSAIRGANTGVVGTDALATGRSGKVRSLGTGCVLSLGVAGVDFNRMAHRARSPHKTSCHHSTAVALPLDEMTFRCDEFEIELKRITRLI